MTAPWWRPDRFARRLPALRVRAAAAKATRRFFESGDFVEVDTPALQICPGLEPHVRVFATRLEELGAADDRTLYLHTSPEFAMKKLLAAGLPRIFQMSHVFRNRERSATHHPEFTLLEWYRAGAGYEALIEDCANLLSEVAAAVGVAEVCRRGARADLTAPPLVLSVSDAFRDHAGIDLRQTFDRAGAPDPARMAAAAAGVGIAAREGDDWDALFFRVFLDRIEPELGVGRATILKDYPVHMAALSRPRPDAPHLAERFELFICGLELANAFGELTDATEQRRRFRADQDLRRRLYGDTLPLDEDFLAALAHGLPPCAGIALGFDRLVMLLAGAERIDDVLWAPVAGPV